jgi:hypothetical protein
LGILEKAFASNFVRISFGVIWTVLVWIKLRILPVFSRLLPSSRFVTRLFVLAVIALAITQAATISKFVIDAIPQTSVFTIHLFLAGFVVFAFAALIAALAGVAYVTFLFLTVVTAQGGQLVNQLATTRTMTRETVEPTDGSFTPYDESTQAAIEQRARWQKEHGFTDEELEQYSKMATGDSV